MNSATDPPGMPPAAAPAPPGGPRQLSPQISFRQKMAIFADRNFLLYWMSGNIAFLGDIFAMFAMQLLVMNLTNGDAAAMGMVMAITGIPRFVFVLFGGAVIDRFSPMRVVIVVRYAMGVMQALLAVVVFFGSIEIWMLYLFAVAGGLLGSFLMPAQMTIMPAILKPEELPAGNALNGSAHQVIQSIAPAVVGFVLALLSGYDIFAGGGVEQDPARELIAYGYAFFINAATFLVSGVMLVWVKVLVDRRANRNEAVLKSIGDGFAMMWRDHSLRAFIIYITFSQLFTMGAQQVGQPIMAMERFQNLDIMPAAVALGLFGTASGVGAVLGSLISGFLFAPSERWFGPIMMAMAVLRGIVLIALGIVHGLAGTLFLFVCFGLFMGYTSVLFMTWFQLRVEISMLGRIMSVLMFSMMGIMPISMALAGWGIDQFGLDNLYLVAGVAMIVVAVGASFSESIRLLGYMPDEAAKIKARRRH